MEVTTQHQGTQLRMGKEGVGTLRWRRAYLREAWWDERWWGQSRCGQPSGAIKLGNES